MVFEFALSSQNIDVVQCLLNIGNLTLKSERNELHLLLREDLSVRILGVDQFSKFFDIKELVVFLLGVIDLWCSIPLELFMLLFLLSLLLGLIKIYSLLFGGRSHGHTRLLLLLFSCIRPLVSRFSPLLFSVLQILFKSGDHVVPLSRLLGDPDCQDTVVHLIINFL